MPSGAEWCRAVPGETGTGSRIKQRGLTRLCKHTEPEAVLSEFERINRNMESLSRRDLDRVYSVLLLAVVLLSWSYVIYGSRVAAHWLLEERTAHLQQH